MSWYKLEAVKSTLGLDYEAAANPSVVKSGRNVEVRERQVGGETYRVFLQWSGPDFLIPHEHLEYVAEGLQIKPFRAFLEQIKARGGLWLGPAPP